MMKKSRIFTLIVINFFLSFCFLGNVQAAGSAKVGFNGNNTVYSGNTITVKAYVSNVSGTDGGVVSLEANLAFDSSYLEYVSGSGSTSPYAFQINKDAGYKIAGLDTTLEHGIDSQATIFTFTFRALKPGNTTITLNNVKLTDTDGRVASTIIAKPIVITNPPSSNNNLSSLSTNVGNINFNKNITSYNVSVGSDVASATILGVAEDSGAKVSGLGNKSLNYGNNKFDITVTSPSGAKKTYTININRKDIRSNNNNLSSLSVNGGELSPGFNKNTTKYSVSVPYSVSDLNVKATPEDSKAKVNVSGNKNLPAEETTEVTVKVTAENGSSKVYTISVTRGKDPNKQLSDNNYLTHLTPSIGILSPVFNKENVNYEIWLPYEIDKVSFDYAVEDTRYATVKFEGNDNLVPGISNIYKIIVTAESGKERAYIISVKRAKNPSENSSSNTNIKSIKLKNGKLTTDFNKSVHEYYYTSKKGFEITEVVLEDSVNSAASIHKSGDTIYIVVTSSSGEYGIYTLRKQVTNIWVYVSCLLLFVIGFLLGFVTRALIKKYKKNTVKKLDSDEKKDVKQEDNKKRKK